MSASPLDIFNEEIHSNILSNLKEHQQRGCTFSVSPELLASFLSQCHLDKDCFIVRNSYTADKHFVYLLYFYLITLLT